MDSEAASNNHASGKKVLCVEDETFISELYERALTKAGYSVKIVADGALALKEAQTDEYDVILLDLMIPTITGTEILKTLRDSSKTPHFKAKVIVTTNLDLSPSVRAEVEKQADAYLLKADHTPSEIVEFINKLRKS